MKRLKFIPLIVISCLFSGCSPDLIVNSFEQTGLLLRTPKTTSNFRLE